MCWQGFRDIALVASMTGGSCIFPQEMLYIVLDTNILLSHLQFLDELKDYSIKGQQYTVT